VAADFKKHSFHYTWYKGIVVENVISFFFQESVTHGMFSYLTQNTYTKKFLLMYPVVWTELCLCLYGRENNLFLIDFGFLQLCQRIYKEEIFQNLFQHKTQDRIMYILLPHMLMLYFNTHVSLTRNCNLIRILDTCCSVKFPTCAAVSIAQSTDVVQVLTTNPIIWSQLWYCRNCDKNVSLF
jgi:hypothetical protein